MLCLAWNPKNRGRGVSENMSGKLGIKQGHGVANDHAAFDHGDQARLPKFLRFMNISLHR